MADKCSCCFQSHLFHHLFQASLNPFRKTTNHGAPSVPPEVAPCNDVSQSTHINLLLGVLRLMVANGGSSLLNYRSVFMFQFDPAVRPALRISAEPSALMTHCECILTWAIRCIDQFDQGPGLSQCSCSDPLTVKDQREAFTTTVS